MSIVMSMNLINVHNYDAEFRSAWITNLVPRAFPFFVGAVGKTAPTKKGKALGTRLVDYITPFVNG